MAGRQTSGDKIGNGPPDSSGTLGTSLPQPIGVPYMVWDPQAGTWVPWAATVDVKPSGPGSMGTQGPGTAPSSGRVAVPPRYFDGAELSPANWDPDRITDLQRRMIAVGLIPKTANVQLHVWDPVSQAAFRDLLAYANTTGSDWLTALNNYSAAEGTNPSGRGPLVTQPSNPDDLRQVFRKAIVDELGQGWDQGRIDRMVASYQADEVAAQTAAYNAVDSGGAVAAPPSPQAYAVTQARAQDPSGAQAHDALGYQTEFFNALGGVV